MCSFAQKNYSKCMLAEILLVNTVMESTTYMLRRSWNTKYSRMNILIYLPLLSPRGVLSFLASMPGYSKSLKEVNSSYYLKLTRRRHVMW
jgi:hypothetical protein